METRANYALIGLFTVAVIAGAFGFVLWFAGGEKPGKRQTYKIVFTGSISGLSQGGWVLFNGVRVGEVTTIALLPEDPSQVYALIDVDATAPVRTDTKAKLEYTGFTGVASVSLTGGTTNAPALVGKDGPPVIFAERSEFQDLIESARQVASEASSFLAKGNKLLDDNSTSLSASLKNAEIFTGSLAANADGIKDFMAVLKPMTVKLDSLVSNADNVMKTVDPADVKSIVKDFASLSAKLDRAADRVDGVLAGLDSFLGKGDTKNAFAQVGDAAKSIRKVADNLNRFASSGLRQYEALAVDGRQTLDELKRALRSIQSDPQQFLFGRSQQLPTFSGAR
jgi:phospholipid/cholesterol/gamma-HCH transport system substrate-binding protein